MGKLIIYTGPMKSGKTTKLIEQYIKTLNKDSRTGMFKPKLDTRWSATKVIDRNGNNQIISTLLDDIDMLWNFKDMYKNFFIDEFQFLEGNISTINKLLELGKNIWVAGLNLTTDKKPFGLMGDLMCFANTIYILKGNCDCCGKQNNGIYTIYDGIKNTNIIVGDDKYKCVCSKCYIKYNILG